MPQQRNGRTDQLRWSEARRNQPKWEADGACQGPAENILCKRVPCPARFAAYGATEEASWENAAFSVDSDERAGFRHVENGRKMRFRGVGRDPPRWNSIKLLVCSEA